MEHTLDSYKDTSVFPSSGITNMTKKQYESKLQELRIKWKANPNLRDIIERQAKALKRAWEEKVKKSGDDDLFKFAKELFGDLT